MTYIRRFREYIENNGTRFSKLKNIEEFMFNHFMRKEQFKKKQFMMLTWNFMQFKYKRIKLEYFQSE